MAADKLLGRMEKIEWHPPLLRFVIERHGGTQLGSTRAELQHWVLNLQEGTAAIAHIGQRQLLPKAPGVKAEDLQEIALKLAGLIAARADDPRLHWTRDGAVQVLCTEVFPSSHQETLAGRRKRFKPVLEEALQAVGWRPLGGFKFRKELPLP